MAPKTCTASLLAGACLALLLGSATASLQLPAGFKKCPRDNTISNCLLEAVPAAIKELTHGHPEFELEPLDPLHIYEVAVARSGGDGPINMDIKLINITSFGVSKSVTTDTAAELDKYHFSMRGHSPELYVETLYEVDGRVGEMELKASGTAHYNITKMHAQIDLFGEPVTIDGKTHMKIKEFKIDFYQIDHMAMQFDDLFKDNPGLTADANRNLNDNWRELWDEVRPALETVLGHGFRDYCRKIFDRVAWDDLFAS